MSNLKVNNWYWYEGEPCQYSGAQLWIGGNPDDWIDIDLEVLSKLGNRIPFDDELEIYKQMDKAVGDAFKKAGEKSLERYEGAYRKLGED